MHKAELKQILTEVKQNQFQPVENISPSELLPELLTNIGDLDYELRDALIFEVLGEWIYKGIYTEEETLSITQTLLQKEFLLKDLGLPEGDALFTRAFCVLQIFVILYKERERSFLPQETLDEITSQLMTLLRNEKDFRGYVPDKGWGHCIAHTADALAQLVQLPCTSFETQRKILLLIAQKTIEPPFILTADEQERLAEPAALILLQNQNLAPDQLLIPFTSILKEMVAIRTKEIKNFFRYYNARNLMRGIYFYLKSKQETHELSEKIYQELKEMS